MKYEKRECAFSIESPFSVQFGHFVTFLYWQKPKVYINFKKSVKLYENIHDFYVTVGSKQCNLAVT
jgi:hypothetical protein